MFVIDKQNNKIDKIESKTFHELGFKEREHLQEWIAKYPSCLGDEELLIIQKEFDGFNDTNERLDLLALDKFGALVIIENKLDDTGRDVNWQALKYVSYCSTLSVPQIVDIYQAYLDKQSSNAEGDDDDDNRDDLINKYLITIEKFDSDRVRGRIAEFNERCFLNQKPGKKFKEIKVSETGLEMIESISVDCTRKTGAWHSDAEILIDKFGLVRLNGTKTNKYWNGTIACSKKPLRLRLRNICGDETEVVL